MPPSWFEHVDLMNVIIGLLCFIVAGFVKREFKRFESKLNEMCKELSEKATTKELTAFRRLAFHHLHDHDHHVKCNADNCKPTTAGVIIRERRADD